MLILAKTKLGKILPSHLLKILKIVILTLLWWIARGPGICPLYPNAPEKCKFNLWQCLLLLLETASFGEMSILFLVSLWHLFGLWARLIGVVLHFLSLFLSNIEEAFFGVYFLSQIRSFFFVFEFSRIIGFRAAQNGWNKNKTATSTFLVQSQYLRRAALVEKFKADYLDNLLQRWSLLLRHPSIYR